MPKVSLIWAQGNLCAIGRDNTLPWSLPEDLAYFKKQTLGHPVLMGRRTFESLGRPLPGRKNIVVSGQPTSLPSTVIAVKSLEDALVAAAGAGQVFVIGGGTLYRQALDFSDEALVTEVDVDVPGADTWAPTLDLNVWVLTDEGEWKLSTSGLRYRFLRYQRRERRLA